MLENILKEIDQLLKPEPAAFKSVGLVFEEYVEKVENEKTLRRYIYKNPDSKICLDINCYFRADRFNPIFCFFNDKGKSFLLSEYCKFKDKKEYADLYSKSIYKQINNMEYLKELLNLTSRLVTTDMKDIITGKVWEDIPTDWMGHK